jgi:hypothetical protein
MERHARNVRFRKSRRGLIAFHKLLDRLAHRDEYALHLHAYADIIRKFRIISAHRPALYGHGSRSHSTAIIRPVVAPAGRRATGWAKWHLAAAFDHLRRRLPMQRRNQFQSFSSPTLTRSRNGFAASLNRPGGDITGVFTLNPELVAKRLEILREVVPAAKWLFW